MEGEVDLKLVTYCGLHCDLCAQRTELPDKAGKLIQILHDEGFDDFYMYVPEMKDTFPPFWQFLQNLASFECSCRDGRGGPPDCPMRICAVKKGVVACPFCESYPCEHVKGLGERYPLLIPDGLRMRKIGMEKWLKEQEERGARGFRYAQVRYHDR